MPGDKEVVDWRRLREFADVDLARSFVLSWYVEAGTLFIDVDVLLLPEHPLYEKPRPAERVCIRPALIEFPFCEAVRADGLAGDSIQSAVSGLGHGAIAGLQRRTDGRYELRGDFGVVAIEAERPILRLKGP